MLDTFFLTLSRNYALANKEWTHGDNFMDLSKGTTIDPSYVFRLLIPTKGPVEVTPLDVRHTGLSTVMFPKAGRVSKVLGGGNGKGYVSAKDIDR